MDGFQVWRISFRLIESFGSRICGQNYVVLRVFETADPYFVMGGGGEGGENAKGTTDGSAMIAPDLISRAPLVCQRRDKKKKTFVFFFAFSRLRLNCNFLLDGGVRKVEEEGEEKKKKKKTTPR